MRPGHCRPAGAGSRGAGHRTRPVATDELAGGRAIRIEPQNGALWHELARVRFQQGSYEQAMQLANRSNALLAADSTLRARNDELINAAREARSY